MRGSKMTGTEYKDRIIEKYSEKSRIWENAFEMDDMYQFSNDGLVKSLEKIIVYKDGRKRLYKERILKPGLTTGGYFNVTLYKDGKKKQYGVHQLVCTAFHGECPPGMECRHKNNDKTDNHESNLCWGTPSENQADRIVNGTTNRGEQCPTSKLTQDEVNEIRKLYVPRIYTLQMLADKYNITPNNVYHIIKYKTWKH
jgi:hypothetical protein